MQITGLLGKYFPSEFEHKLLSSGISVLSGQLSVYEMVYLHLMLVGRL